MQSTTQTPEVAPGISQSAASLNLGDKRAVAALAGNMSVRWVDGQLALGMPHLKLGPRRVRFDLGEVREWLKSSYGQQRRGKN